MSFWSATNQAHAFNVLRGAGLSSFGAAALVSRWANVESTGGGPTAVNPSSKAFGIAQWLGARKAGIYPNTNFDAQLRYAVSELNGSESRAGSVLRSANNADAGARGASMYERAEGYNAQTGRDNFTSRTAAGVNGVLAAAGAGVPAAPGVQPPATQTANANNDDDSPAAPQDFTPVLLLGLAGLGLYFWLK